MEILIAIGSINAFFFSLVILGKRNRTKADKLLAIMFVVLGFSFGIVYLSYILQLPILQLFVWNISLLFAPLLYLYALLLINRNIKIKKTYLFTFIPYLVSWVYLALLFVFYSETEIETLFNSKLKDTSVLFVFFTIIETLSIPVYIALIVRLLRKVNSVQPNPKTPKLSFRLNDAKSIVASCMKKSPEEEPLFSGDLSAAVEMTTNWRFLHFQLSSLKLSGRKDSEPKLSTDMTLVWLRVLMIGVLFIWLLINSLYYLSPLSSEISLKYGFGISSIIIFCLGYIIQSKKLFMK